MCERVAEQTSASLLQRVQQDGHDPAAWGEFVQRYGPKILGWCRHWRLQDADAHDVTQEVLASLVERLRRFRYDPTRSFRAWLKTVTRNALADFLARQRRPGEGTGDSAVLVLLDSVAARGDLETRLEEVFDQEVLDEASARVRTRAAPATWEAFRLLTHEHLSGAEVAARVGMQVATVYVAKSKVLKMLREEIELLEKGEPA